MKTITFSLLAAIAFVGGEFEASFLRASGVENIISWGTLLFGV